MELNQETFRKKVEDSNTSLEEVSIFLPDDCFECNLKNSVDLKPIMFLGLNRSLPDIYNLDYNNMRGAILELKFEKSLLNSLLGSYISDFVKNEILKGVNVSDKTKAVEINKILKNNPNLVKKCGDILKKEIENFRIKFVFCFGNEVFDNVKEYFKIKEFIKEEDSLRFITNDEINFFKINHYSKSNASGRKKVQLEIIKILTDAGKIARL